MWNQKSFNAQGNDPVLCMNSNPVFRKGFGGASLAGDVFPPEQRKNAYFLRKI